MRTPNNPAQSGFFLEIIEFRTTADLPFECSDGSFGALVVRPSGKGWRPLPLKFQPERRTKWMRRRAVIPAGPRRASRGGGGWLR